MIVLGDRSIIAGSPLRAYYGNIPKDQASSEIPIPGAVKRLMTVYWKALLGRKATNHTYASQNSITFYTVCNSQFSHGLNHLPRLRRRRLLQESSDTTAVSYKDADSPATECRERESNVPCLSKVGARLLTVAA
ncbi:hypothetical protein KIN20_036017 [Parelaphostrongylus tenuis]|uniref:Uncharacterized protein n=1 Tax=Parelaphostrongylus tenuis TaxID=148309 RepID=A0AAD5RC19_PARTN|nr:hypothetical protein KIN20_036017 [Parelaphostrongylus tenuis]